MLKALGFLIAVIAIVFGLISWISLSWVYSDGERAGYVQKFSRRGYVCKTWEGEMAMVTMPGTLAEKFAFTVRDPQVAAKINADIGQRLAMHYEQHKWLPSSCFGDTEYFVTSVTSAETPSRCLRPSRGRCCPARPPRPPSRAHRRRACRRRPRRRRFRSRRRSSPRRCARLPAALLALVGLRQPLLQRAQSNRGWRWRPSCRDPAIFSSASCQGRLCPISSMAFSRLPGGLVAVDRAAVERLRAARGLRQRAMKLELQDIGQEVAHVRDIGRHVIFRAGIEIRFAAARPAARCPGTSGAAPTRSGCISPAGSRRRTPSSATGRSSARRAGRRSSPAPCAAAGRCPWKYPGPLSSKPDLHQVLRRHRERDGVADGLVESVVGAVAEQVRLLVVGALVEVVARARGGWSGNPRAVISMHIFRRRSLTVSMSQALAWHTTSRSRGLSEHRALPEGLAAGARSPAR